MKKKLSPEKAKQKEIRKAKHTKKKLATSLSWSHVERIRNNMIVLKSKKKEEYVLGIKLIPRNLFIENSNAQILAINQIRSVLNQINFKLYWAVCHNPVNLDAHLSELSRQMQEEEDPVIWEMIENDFEKAAWFQQTHVEIEFFLMVKDHNYENCVKKYNQLVGLFLSTGYRFKELDDFDYENYLAYLYENPMINNFYFSHGIFSSLKDEDYEVRSGKEYGNDIDDIEKLEEMTDDMEQ